MNNKMPISVWILVIAMALNTTAASFLWPFNTLYINGYLGESMTLAGVALLVNSALAIAGNYIGGTLFDRVAAGSGRSSSRSAYCSRARSVSCCSTPRSSATWLGSA